MTRWWVLTVALTGCLDYERLSVGLGQIERDADAKADSLKYGTDGGEVTDSSSSDGSEANDGSTADMASPFGPPNPTWAEAKLSLPPDFPPTFQFSSLGKATGTVCSSHADCSTRYCHDNICTLSPVGAPPSNGAESCVTGYYVNYIFTCSCCGMCGILLCSLRPAGMSCVDNTTSCSNACVNDICT